MDILSRLYTDARDLPVSTADERDRRALHAAHVMRKITNAQGGQGAETSAGTLEGEVAP